MKIAVTSQNIGSVTAHAGRCRKFWVYELPKGSADMNKQFIELEIDETLHSMTSQLPAKLSGINVLITANLGDSLKMKLLKVGVTTHLSTDDDTPDNALLNYLAKEQQKH